MKNLIVAIFLLNFGFVSSAQKPVGYVVTNANDTIPCTFLVSVNPFNNAIFHATSVYKSVRILTESGEKIKFYPKDLSSFYIKGTTDGNMKFVSFKQDGFKHFYHEISSDRLSYYRLYHSNAGIQPNGVFKEFAFKDNKFLQVGTPGTRENLTELISDNPTMYDKWTHVNKYYKARDAYNIINQYNAFYKEKFYNY